MNSSSGGGRLRVDVKKTGVEAIWRVHRTTYLPGYARDNTRIATRIVHAQPRVREIDRHSISPRRDHRAEHAWRPE